MGLNEVRAGQSAVIEEIRCEGPLKQRFLDLGLYKGVRVKVLRLAPLNDPMILEVKDFSLALRKSDAARLAVGEVF